MTKKKSLLVKLLAATVVLTLISCCFLGYTFARYTTSGSGSATTQAAKWDISLTKNGTDAMSDTVDFQEKLSPDITNSFNASQNNRVNTTSKVLVAVIENKSDVKADVTIAVGDLEATLNSKTFAQDGGITAQNLTGDATEAQFKAVFGVTVYYATQEGAANATSQVNGSAISLEAATSGTGGGKIWVYAQVTWTSQDQDSTEEVADAIDTWFGTYLTSVKFGMTYKAVQSSELPNA